ncbi:MAG: trypsin-like peptidase domain-containing protein [Phycisphaerae bacterium]
MVTLKVMRWIGASTVALTVVLVLWAAGAGRALHADNPATEGAAGGGGKATPTIAPEVSAPLAEFSKVFRSVHNALKDAVVNIDTSRRMPAGGMGHGLVIPPGLLPPELMPPEGQDELPPMHPAPKKRGGGGGSDGSGQPQLMPFGTGSGVIVSANGYILTNNHVVEGADSITVRLDNNRTLKAKVIGTDPKSDLAVIKIEADKLTYARLGDSDTLEVGDWVLAFGSPFGFDQTMTQGIISAKGRQIDIIGSNNPALAGLTYENFLQTDAAINPGNSGGPLVNLKGEVIGINTAIASRTGSYTGLGFAIPSNDARIIMESLIKTGKVVRGYLGVGIADVTDPKVQAEVKALGYEGTGVLVSEIRPKSPGGLGGLKLKDIITTLNGKKVETITQLRTEIARTAPGTKVNLTVFRGGKQVELSFALGTQPDSVLASGATGTNPAKGAVDWEDLGITVSESPKGLTITALEPNGLAAGTGLGKGDVIFNVQNKDVKTLDELREAMAQAKIEKGIHISVHAADGSDRSVFITAQ